MMIGIVFYFHSFPSLTQLGPSADFAVRFAVYIFDGANNPINDDLELQRSHNLNVRKHIRHNYGMQNVSYQS